MKIISTVPNVLFFKTSDLYTAGLQELEIFVHVFLCT